MKTKIVVEIESPDGKDTKTLPEEGQSEEDFEGKEKELLEFREGYAKDLHNYIISHIKEMLNVEDDNDIIESLCESDYSIDGREELSDYGIKIKAETQQKE